MKYVHCVVGFHSLIRAYPLTGVNGGTGVSVAFSLYVDVCVGDGVGIWCGVEGRVVAVAFGKDIIVVGAEWGGATTEDDATSEVCVADGECCG